MSKPELLSETDKYFLEPGDFTQQLDKFIFSAIYNLYVNGAEKIHAADVDNYLQQNSLAKQLMEKENGLSLPVIQKLVGHIEGSKITDNIYTDISFDFISQELKKIK